MSDFIIDPFDEEKVVNLVQGGVPRTHETYEIWVEKLGRGETATVYGVKIGKHTLSVRVAQHETNTLEGILPDKPYRRRMVVRQDGRVAVGNSDPVPVIVAIEQSADATVFVAVQAELHHIDE